jgi:hypothetical protein
MKREYSSEIKVLNDLPIHSLEEDKFGRKQLVEMIVKSIENYLHNPDNEDCLVYGIYGKWGEGKSSFMNMIDSKLLQDNRIKRIHLNPWHTGVEETMIRDIIIGFTSNFGKEERETFMKYIKAFAYTISSIVDICKPGVGNATEKAVESIDDIINPKSKSIYVLKRELFEKIRSEPSKKYIVFIDDIDRLDKNELHYVFRLVRQIADFPNTIYILAMDPEIVAKSIGTFYGEGGRVDGMEFLDKIVQVPIVLPTIQQDTLRKELTNELTSIINNHLPIRDIDYIIDEISPLFLNLRSIIRYINQLSFVLPSLIDRVDLCDLCMLEAIKNVSPQAYQEIYNNRNNLLKITQESDFLLNDSQKIKVEEDRYQKAISSILASIPDQFKKMVQGIINKLFHSSGPLVDTYNMKNICVRRYLNRYFTQLIPIKEIPDEQLNSKSREIVKWDAQGLKTWIDKEIKSYPSYEVIWAIEYMISYIAEEKLSDNVPSFISKFCKAMSISEVSNSSSGMEFDFCRFISNTLLPLMNRLEIKNLGETKTNVDYVKDSLCFIFDNSKIDFCIELICSFDEGLEVTYIDKETIDHLWARFGELSYAEQMTYGDRLFRFFNIYNKLESESFRDYSTRLFNDVSFDYKIVLSAFINKSDDSYWNIDAFCELFKGSISVLLSRMEKDKNRDRRIEEYLKKYLKEHKED